MNWGAAITTVSPHVVRIETPSGWGTGFLAFYNHDHSWCGVATAAHVVSHADEWQQPIRVRTADLSNPRFLKENERIIFVDHATDSAVMFFVKGNLQLPEVPVTLMPTDVPCSIGSDVGWLGFPTIEPQILCFFAGTISASQSARKAYLIDGVAINGVSGGPVFHCPTSQGPQIIGCVSAYHANRATGEALPGLLRAQDVSHFHAVAQQIQSWDAAAAQKQEFDEAQKQKAQLQIEDKLPFSDAPPMPSQSGQNT
jgi:hypothetical protein